MRQVAASHDCTAAPGLALLRVLAMALVILFHSAFPYSSVRDASLLWLIYEPNSSLAIDGLVYISRGIHMPLFFLLAGFWAEQSYRKRGCVHFLIQRSGRLLIPLALGTVTILPLTYAVWQLGLHVGDMQNLSAEQRAAFPNGLSKNLMKLGFAHLWFLEYLFLVSVAYAGIRWTSGLIVGRVSNPSEVRPTGWKPVLPYCVVPVLLAALTFVLLWSDLRIWTRMYPPMIPSLGKLAYYGLFFLGGVWLAARQEFAAALKPAAGYCFALSVPVFAFVWMLGVHDAEQALVEPLRAGLAASVALSTWFALWGLLGLSLHLRALGPRLRFLFDASLWVFWSHLPLLAFLQVCLAMLPLPVGAKLLICAALTGVGCIVTYRLLVRNRTLGSLLEAKPGRRTPDSSLRRAA